MELRKKNELSQEEMAEKIGISISYYSKVEGGFKPPSYQLLIKLRRVFGEEVDMNDFF